jgi:hypothetical protein
MLRALATQTAFTTRLTRYSRGVGSGRSGTAARLVAITQSSGRSDRSDGLSVAAAH